MLSSLALDENSSDDFAKFASQIIEPLFTAGIATVQLDNTGHGDKNRARGSSSKGDLADVLYTLKQTTAFDQNRRGALRLVRAHSRFGDVAPAFTMALGGGHFGAFEADEGAEQAAKAPFRPSLLMERVSLALEHSPGLSKKALRLTVKGRAAYTDTSLEILIAEGYVRVHVDGQAHEHHVVRPFREAADADRVHRVQPCPSRVPDTGAGDRVPVSPPRDTGHGTRSADTADGGRSTGHGQRPDEGQLP